MGVFSRPVSYLVEKDYELIEGISRLAYRRVSISTSQRLSQRVYVDQADLDAALMKDRQQTMRSKTGDVTNTGEWR